jgi:branched-chain amino acid transport system ATP-binding protein
MIRLEGLTAWYGGTQALFGIDLELAQGRTVGLVGTNGSGKTTTLRAILGQLRTAGRVVIDDRDVSGVPTYRRVRDHRIAVVHEGRGLLTGLTVRENLLVGADRVQRARLGEALDLFPALRDRLSQNVSLLSGGQQQMVALGRAILRKPDYLLMDEPALGLAPSIIADIYGTVRELCSSGLGVLLVEQSVARAAEVADVLCLVRVGRISRTVDAKDTAAVGELVRDAFDLQDRPGAGPEGATR